MHEENTIDTSETISVGKNVHMGSEEKEKKGRLCLRRDVNRFGTTVYSRKDNCFVCYPMVRPNIMRPE